MKSFNLIELALCTVLFVLSCTNANNKQEDNVTLLEIYYGMAADTINGEYLQCDTVLEKFKSIKKQECSAICYNNNDSSKYKLSFGLYLDDTYPSDKVQKVIDEYVYDRIIRDLSYYCKNVDLENINQASLTNYPHPTEVIFQSGKRLFERITSSLQPQYADTFYYEIFDGRVCVISHKLYEDQELATYIVQSSIDYNGSCGCNSSSDYITINKETGKVLTSNDIVSKESLNTFKQKLHQAFISAKNQKGFEGTLTLVPDSLIKNMDGCAIVNEGILCYFHPYKIGCGAEGQYNIIVKKE